MSSRSILARGRVQRVILGAITALLLSFLPANTPSVQAAPAEQACQAGAFRQRDMAGVYVTAEWRIRVEVYACGGNYIQWENTTGTHYAVYRSTGRLPGGGIAAVPMNEGGSFVGARLDSTNVVGLKPAEPGFVQLITVDSYGNIVGVYRLRKIA